jgi:hypothetical protein
MITRDDVLERAYIERKLRVERHFEQQIDAIEAAIREDIRKPRPEGTVTIYIPSRWVTPMRCELLWYLENHGYGLSITGREDQRDRTVGLNVAWR